RFKRTPQDVYGPVLVELGDYGLLADDTESIRLTRRGRLLGNEVFYRFLP
ncbi:MAG TPA: oxygen-independent coproporphyrinogen III oxidase, partial [Chloroflexota bacterium]|nr:oxygen-independent coproporphyrinogen III oxidase [Chloroflexota bacterium]